MWVCVVVKEEEVAETARGEVSRKEVAGSHRDAPRKFNSRAQANRSLPRFTCAFEVRKERGSCRLRGEVCLRLARDFAPGSMQWERCSYPVMDRVFGRVRVDGSASWSRGDVCCLPNALTSRDCLRGAASLD